MNHIVPIKIECRNCFGDGWVEGYGRLAKFTCRECEGKKHVWIDPAYLRGRDVVIRK